MAARERGGWGGDGFGHYMASAGVRSRIEEWEGGPCLVLDGHTIDVSVALDLDGTATSAGVQCLDPPIVLDALLTAFAQLGWMVAAEDE